MIVGARVDLRVRHGARKYHLTNHVRRNHPKPASAKQVIGAAVLVRQKTWGAGRGGPEALKGLQRAL